MIAIADKPLFNSTTCVGPFQSPIPVNALPPGINPSAVMVLKTDGEILGVWEDGSYKYIPAGTSVGYFQCFMVSGGNLVCAYGFDAANQAHEYSNPANVRWYQWVIPFATTP